MYRIGYGQVFIISRVSGDGSLDIFLYTLLPRSSIISLSRCPLLFLNLLTLYSNHCTHLYFILSILFHPIVPSFTKVCVIHMIVKINMGIVIHSLVSGKHD